MQDNIQAIKGSLPKEVTFIVVTKTYPPEMILKVYDAGHKMFGENKVNEMLEKYKALPKDIEWHLIGHLQTNKVKYIASFVKLIHSVDSLKEQVRNEFRSLKIFYDKLQNRNHNLQTLSMGMSSDYILAIEEGSNMIRIGSAIFGKR